MPRSDIPPQAPTKGNTTTPRDSRRGKLDAAAKKSRGEVFYRTYPSAAGPKNLTRKQIKKALEAA